MGLGFIFEKNPLVYMWNHMWVEKPKPFSEMNKWEKQLKGIDTTWRDDRMNDDGGRPAISRHLDIHQQNVGFPDFLGVSDTTIIAMDISENAFQLLNAVRLNVLSITDVKEEPLFVRITMTIFKNAAADTFRN